MRILLFLLICHFGLNTASSQEIENSEKRHEVGINMYSLIAHGRSFSLDCRIKNEYFTGITYSINQEKYLWVFGIDYYSSINPLNPCNKDSMSNAYNGASLSFGIDKRLTNSKISPIIGGSVLTSYGKYFFKLTDLAQITYPTEIKEITYKNLETGIGLLVGASYRFNESLSLSIKSTLNIFYYWVLLDTRTIENFGIKFHPVRILSLNMHF
ncbi:MAG: hypothetical protein IIA45_01055 [Bacteroidetes bacterium]|nr:hypothetical protein [Bacteroidota bacterium]